MFPFQVGGIDIQENIELPFSIEDYRCDVKLGVRSRQRASSLAAKIAPAPAKS
jgi:hypothetical protein